MRSAFQDRLDALPETYRHAREEHVDVLVQEFRAAAGLQVIAVGSGGSFVTARLLARLVQRHHRSVAGAATPLEFGVDAELARGKHLWLFSAEGANPDILAALDLGLAAEPARLTVLCNRADSPLACAAAAAGCHVLAFSTRGQRDGFLATHTLLLSSTLLLRAAAAALGANDPTLAPIVIDGLPIEVWPAKAARRLGSVIGRETLIVVYDPKVAEAAWLVETNMWEAALGNVQIADFRNFAHGRHYWLAKRGPTTSLLALTTPSTEAIWTGIEAALPSDISRARVAFEAAPSTPIAAIWAGMEITRLAGDAAAIDPGKPGVPAFGRAIYNAPGLSSLPRTQDQLVPALRKQAARRTAGLPLESFDDIRRHEQSFRNRIAETALDGVILDYDGTVVDTKARQLPPTELTVATLAAVLERGVVLGIATGRGGSVGDDLRTVLPRAVWPQVFVGYYNGGACLPLVEPLNKESILEDAAFAGLVREVRANPAVANWLEDVKLQRVQVSFIPRRGIGLAALRTAVLEAAGRLRLAGYTALNSSHSVDVLAPTVSKLNLLEFLRSRLGIPSAAFLCVGDSGAWPGNDHDLLATPYALSVDSVSARFDTCWNLLPAGCSGRVVCGFISRPRHSGQRIFRSEIVAHGSNSVTARPRSTFLFFVCSTQCTMRLSTGTATVADAEEEPHGSAP